MLRPTDLRRSDQQLDFELICSALILKLPAAYNVIRHDVILHNLGANNILGTQSQDGIVPT